MSNTDHLKTATTTESRDEDLVAQAKAGNLQAFETLATRHERSIYTVALRITRNETDAEDITQQTFLNAIEHLNGFRGEASFRTWVQRIATHAALKILRKRRGLPTVSLDQSAGPADDSGPLPHPEFIADWRESPRELAERAETARGIQEALDQLSEKHRLVFLLRDVQGFSVKETADALGLSEANVKVRLLRARLQLREQLTAVFGDASRRLEPHRHADP